MVLIYFLYNLIVFLRLQYEKERWRYCGRIATKKNPSSYSIPSNDAMDYDGDIGPSVRTTGDPRISANIVPSVNLINVSKTSKDN
jgi:hypothetical protein